MTDWRNRIISTAIVRADSLLANSENWRVHPKAQQEALSTAIEHVGLVAPCVVNKRSSALWGQEQGIETLVDGHLRASLALRQGDATELPVIFVDLDPDEERIVLASLDSITAMAVPDRDKLSELIASVETEDASILSLLSTVAAEEKMPNFEPIDEMDARRLDERKPITCPECGHEFTV
jgi:hypothetical protein